MSQCPLSLSPIRRGKSAWSHKWACKQILSVWKKPTLAGYRPGKCNWCKCLPPSKTRPQNSCTFRAGSWTRRPRVSWCSLRPWIPARGTQNDLCTCSQQWLSPSWLIPRWHTWNTWVISSPIAPSNWSGRTPTSGSRWMNRALSGTWSILAWSFWTAASTPCLQVAR